MQNNSLGTQIVRLRQRQQLSQAQLAERLFVSRQAISKWEKGAAEPDLDKLVQLSQVFNVDLDYLVLKQTMHRDNILVITNVQKNYTKPVLKGINLTLHRNERVALLGSNGAGKTTLVNLIIGRIQPDAGAIERNYVPKHDLSLMPQQNLLIGPLRVQEMLEMEVKLANLPSQNLERLLKTANLWDQRAQLVMKLSGGQQRKLMFLLTMMKQARFLIFDEPTVGMDLETIDRFWQQLDHLTNTTLVITHDFNQIDHYFDRVVLLKDGVIAADEQVATIHAHNQTLASWYRHFNHS
ncbi:XRE family transcriptional regulator [Fructilactobacillus myrtifloralis]|uniref:XRE family transcriptional regulator n=1 Tax=Fructilactobacillus myrtifloralis TaxID=2940301 RepID=A0ABY5BQM4_9LACO|nr:XRE family transcriptional regulator [Fructilactobacillus myrtifloralis]USS85342.1 XRE family transcriptional regulator [Fructilactobacillus myrtifloralis]